MAKRQLQEKPSDNASAEASGSEKQGGHTVGRGHPPMDTRFKPGQSGNPRGRPKGSRNAKTTIAKVINEKVPVREGEKTHQMTKLEAMLQSHMIKAMKGDARSASLIVGLVTRTGLLNDQDEELLTALSDEDAAIVSDFLRRNAKLSK
jgi:hypothetical protein